MTTTTNTTKTNTRTRPPRPAASRRNTTTTTKRLWWAIVVVLVLRQALIRVPPPPPSSPEARRGDEPNPRTTTTPPTDPPLRLGVPFYVYESEALDWTNLTFSKPLPIDYPETKHSDDLWLARAAKKHPLRTRDPSRAKLFFVPFLLNAVNEQRSCLPLGGGTRKCFQRPGEALRFADKKLSESEFFQKSNGTDHVVVASHWLDPPHKLPHLKRCNLINFEGFRPMPDKERFFLPSFYVGRKCNGNNATTPTTTTTPPSRAFDFAMVATLKEGNPDFATRSKICEWLESSHRSVAACGKGDHCAALPAARYGFHARGDTWGSQRPMDTLLAGTIPIFTHPHQYEILPPLLPWRDLSVLVETSSRAAFDEDVDALLAASDHDRRLRAIAEHAHLLDHTQIYQFDAYLAEFAHRLRLSRTREPDS